MSFSDRACFFAALRLAQSQRFSRLPPPPAASGYSVRWQGEEVDERFEETFRFSLAALLPALFNPSSPNTDSLNQGPAVFSTRLMYRRKSGWSAKPQGTGAHLASGNQGIIVCTVLLSD